MKTNKKKYIKNKNRKKYIKNKNKSFNCKTCKNLSHTFLYQSYINTCEVKNSDM